MDTLTDLLLLLAPLAAFFVVLSALAEMLERLDRPVGWTRRWRATWSYRRHHPRRGHRRPVSAVPSEVRRPAGMIRCGPRLTLRG
jgi:hypothetical protein